jgi:hypothetical protein
MYIDETPLTTKMIPVEKIIVEIRLAHPKDVNPVDRDV